METSSDEHPFVWGSFRPNAKPGAMGRAVVSQILAASTTTLGGRDDEIREWLLSPEMRDGLPGATLFMSFYAGSIARHGYPMWVTHSRDWKVTLGLEATFFPFSFAFFPNGGAPSHPGYADASSWMSLPAHQPLAVEFELPVLDTVEGVMPNWLRGP